MKYKKIYCEKCSKDICANAYTRHARSCAGPKVKKVRGVDFDPNIGYKNGTREAWNKGLTAATNDSVALMKSTLQKRYDNGELRATFKKHSEDSKLKISLKLKQSHINGHPGWSHKNDDPNRRSYPERWFLTAINNDDRFKYFKFIEQHKQWKYWIDFAFIEKKIAVEIDGCQHEISAVKNKDKIRDEYLVSQGWTLHRMKWKEVFKNPKKAMSDLYEILK
jgi:very-short-patch-repair endonuclease